MHVLVYFDYWFKLKMIFDRSESNKIQPCCVRGTAHFRKLGNEQGILRFFNLVLVESLMTKLLANDEKWGI